MVGWLVGWVRSVGRHPRGAICAFFAVIQQHAPPQKWAWTEQRFVNLENTQFSKYTNNFFKAIPNKFLRGCKRLINFQRNWCRPQNFRFSHREGDSAAKYAHTHTHKHTCVWPPTRTGTLTARIVHTAHSSWPRTTNALATPPRTVPLSFCTTRPAAMLWLRAFAFVFRSCDKRRQLTLSRIHGYCCCCCFVISLIWLQQQVERGGGEESNSGAGLAQFAFTWPRVSLLLCSTMPLCVRACVCVVWWERVTERETACSLRSSPQTILLLPIGLLSVVVSLQTPVVCAGTSFLQFTHGQCCQTVAIVLIYLECPYEGDMFSLNKEYMLY